jgi:release factor glutamine methyltransferase
MGGLTINSAMAAGSGLLEQRGVDDPRAEAALLLAFALERPREYMYLEPETLLTTEQERFYWQVLSERARRVPYAYIVGSREFMGLDFAVSEAVLIPRPETETLVETVLAQKHLWRQGAGCDTSGCAGAGCAGAGGVSLLDLCTGSGAVALALAAHWRELTYVVGTDVSGEALAVACGNGRRLGIAAVWRQGDLWEAVGDEVFDCITANPPYISDGEYERCAPEVRCEPRLALWGGADGLDFYRRIAAGAADHLRPAGRMYLEIGWQQGRPVCGLLESTGFVTEVVRDLGGRERVVTAWRAAAAH